MKNIIIMSVLFVCYCVICTFEFFLLLGVIDFAELNCLFCIAMVISMPVTYVNRHNGIVLALLNAIFIWSLIVCQVLDMFIIMPDIIYAIVSGIDVVCIALITDKMGIELRWWF